MGLEILAYVGMTSNYIETIFPQIYFYLLHNFTYLFILRITFTPTIQHCSMATVIGLCLREKLKDFFPPHFKVDFCTL